MLDKTKKEIKEKFERDTMESPIIFPKTPAEELQDVKKVAKALKEDVKDALKKKSKK